MAKKYWLCGFLMLAVFLSLDAQESPPWVILEQGKVAFDESNLSQAQQLFFEAAQKNGEYPEAEFWLGQVYEAQGQPELAEEQYRRALSYASLLVVRDQSIQIQYTLAQLLLNRGEARREEARAILSGIANQEGASDPEQLKREHLYVDRLLAGGLDELLYLYRDELTHSLRSRRILGEMAWEDGQYRTALVHSMRSVLSMLSTLSQRRREVDPHWRFDIDPLEDPLRPDKDVRFPLFSDGVAELLAWTNRQDYTAAQWLEQEGFWSQVYLLASALFAGGHGGAAQACWEVLVVSGSLEGDYIPRNGSGRWGSLAVKQLENPFISVGTLAP